MLQSASEQYGLLERNKEKMEEEHAAALKQSTTVIKEMKDELDKANVLLSASAKKGWLIVYFVFYILFLY